MRGFLLVTLFALAATAAFEIQRAPAVQVPGGAATQASGACGCPKTAPVCCRNCNGSFAYCARSYAFCPECPAP